MSPASDGRGYAFPDARQVTVQQQQQDQLPPLLDLRHYKIHGLEQQQQQQQQQPGLQPFLGGATYSGVPMQATYTAMREYDGQARRPEQRPMGPIERATTIGMGLVQARPSPAQPTLQSPAVARKRLTETSPAASVAAVAEKKQRFVDEAGKRQASTTTSEAQHVPTKRVAGAPAAQAIARRPQLEENSAPAAKKVVTPAPAPATKQIDTAMTEESSRTHSPPPGATPEIKRTSLSQRSKSALKARNMLEYTYDQEELSRLAKEKLESMNRTIPTQVASSAKSAAKETPPI
jgi:hypothetical protein